MNFRIIGVVIGREYSTRVKKKSFLITTFLVPVLFAALCCIPVLILTLSKGKDKHIAYVDESGYVAEKLVDTKSVFFENFTGHLTAEELKNQMENLDFDGIMIISPVAEGKEANVSVTTYSTKPVSVDIKEMLESQIEEAVEDYRLQQYDIEDLKQIMSDVKADVQISTFTIDDAGEEKQTSSEVYMLISMFLAIVIYMFVTMFSGMVMQSVLEEKTSRVVEVLVSSVKAVDLMIGKIVGVALVALTQFLLWIVLTGAIVFAVNSIVGFDNLVGSNPDAAMQMTQMGGMGVDAAMIEQATAAMSADGENGEMVAVLQTLQNLNYVKLLISFLLYFVFGYLLYASLFAAVGASVDNEADTQQLQLPLTIPLMLGFFVGLYAFNSPDSQLVWWCSMIPFTSPIVMLARIPFGVANWELILSLAILFATFLGGAWVSAKIYKVGILMFGKKSTFKDLWKWLKMK